VVPEPVVVVVVVVVVVEVPVPGVAELLGVVPPPEEPPPPPPPLPLLALAVGAPLAALEGALLQLLLRSQIYTAK